MTQQHINYFAEKFLSELRTIPVERRLAFDAWSDRHDFGPDVKRRLWREVKSVARTR